VVTNANPTARTVLRPLRPRWRFRGDRCGSL